jgi:hypothetical protein
VQNVESWQDDGKESRREKTLLAAHDEKENSCDAQAQGSEIEAEYISAIMSADLVLQ